MASKAQLQSALVSALRYIASEKYDEFVDEDGHEVDNWFEGNLSESVMSNDFGSFDFDFNECLGLLKSDGVGIEGPANRKQYDFSWFLQQFRTREGAERVMNKVKDAVNNGE